MWKKADVDAAPGRSCSAIRYVACFRRGTSSPDVKWFWQSAHRNKVIRVLGRKALVAEMVQPEHPAEPFGRIQAYTLVDPRSSLGSGQRVMSSAHKGGIPAERDRPHGPAELSLIARRIGCSARGPGTGCSVARLLSSVPADPRAARSAKFDCHTAVCDRGAIECSEAGSGGLDIGGWLPSRRPIRAPMSS